MTRAEKLEKWELIYSAALGVMHKHIGNSKVVYGACAAIQTASREMVMIERAMNLAGEMDRKKLGVSSIGWVDLVEGSPPDVNA
jgi:hypothetical protein